MRRDRPDAPGKREYGNGDRLPLTRPRLRAAGAVSEELDVFSAPEPLGHCCGIRPAGHTAVGLLLPHDDRARAGPAAQGHSHHTRANDGYSTYTEVAPKV